MKVLTFDLLQSIGHADSLGMWHVEASTLFGNLGYGPSAMPRSFEMDAFGRRIKIHQVGHQLSEDGEEVVSIQYSSQGNGYLEFNVWND